MNLKTKNVNLLSAPGTTALSLKCGICPGAGCTFLYPVLAATKERTLLTVLWVPDQFNMHKKKFKHCRKRRGKKEKERKEKTTYALTSCLPRLLSPQFASAVLMAE